MRSARLGTLLSRMIFFIMAVPPPSMFILDSFIWSGPAGIIAPNSRSTADLSPLGASSRRSALRPQKVKNMATSSPMATAPLAMMNAASTLSRSPEKMMNVFFSFIRAAGPDKPAGPPLRKRAANPGPSGLISRRWCPFLVAQAGASRRKPGSETWASTSSPALRPSMVFCNFMIGPGQARPVQSRSTSTPVAAAGPAAGAAADSAYEITGSVESTSLGATSWKARKVVMPPERVLTSAKPRCTRAR